MRSRVSLRVSLRVRLGVRLRVRLRRVVPGRLRLAKWPCRFQPCVIARIFAVWVARAAGTGEGLRATNCDIASGTATRGP